jgi:hypothetical protein
MTSHEEKRRSRIQIIKNTITKAKEKGKAINKEKLVATCCIDWGCSRRTVLEYISIIEMAS